MNGLPAQQDSKNILRYWFDVEALMYPDLPKDEKRKPVRCIREGDPLPWASFPYLDFPDDWKFFVYFGLIRCSVLETELFDLFRPDKQEERYSGNHERKARRDNTFLLAIEVSGAGRPRIDSLQLAAFSVAFARRKNGKAPSYSAVAGAVKEKAATLLAEHENGPVGVGWFDALTELLISELNWRPRELMAQERLYARWVPLVTQNRKRIKTAPELDPVNSFFLDDIALVLNSAENDGLSAQVLRYLATEIADDKKIDVTQLPAVDLLLAAENFSLGRWPSTFPLFLMQQVAVNTALRELRDGGIFSVNGPPGTGKTTLLMDTIAARIVERAQVLATFDRPSDAFRPSDLGIDYPINEKGKVPKGSYYRLDERLLDFGIVVASANNNAVENITRALPDIKKVDAKSVTLDGAPFDYFARTAESILNAEVQINTHKTPANEDIEQDEASEEEGEVDVVEKVRCWGLLSVPLGNQTNRNLVADRLGPFSDHGFVNTLKAIPLEDLDWNQARSRFRDAVAEVERIRARIIQYDKSGPALRQAREKLEVARKHAHSLTEQLSRVRATLSELNFNINDKKDILRVNGNARDQLRRDWPWWRQLFTYIFKREAFDAFHAKRTVLVDNDEKFRSSLSALMTSREIAREKVSSLTQQVESAKQSAIDAENKVGQIDAQRYKLSKELGEAAFDMEVFETLATEVQQKSLPRSNASYHEARARVLVAALHLHKAFMKQAIEPFRTNFQLALAMIKREAFVRTILPEMGPHLWATFFLAVPVVSSTFASISRCFADLGEGQIGLLLIDEAGQAVPYHALGAIWRSKRALVVGDPLQVEPTITMDEKLDAEMLRHHRASADYLVTQYSAQHLADRGNRHGSSVPCNGKPLWVGSPLRVHHRCVEPMFSLANRIAYNNQMVFGPSRKKEIEDTRTRPLYGATRWFDIVAQDFEEHFSPKQARYAFDIVKRYRREGWVRSVDGLPDIFIISPFKTVALGMHHLLEEQKEEWVLRVDEDVFAKWIKQHVGTVHAFQGKECESVIFLLGGCRDGAIKWATGAPNIINVAVTRAKRRLYVIGDRNRWMRFGYGEKLGAAVPLDAESLLEV